MFNLAPCLKTKRGEAMEPASPPFDRRIYEYIYIFIICI